MNLSYGIFTTTFSGKKEHFKKLEKWERTVSVILQPLLAGKKSIFFFLTVYL